MKIKYNVTSKSLHDWQDILGPLEGCNGCVDPRKVSLPNALANGPNRC